MCNRFCDEHYENQSRALSGQLIADKTLNMVSEKFFLTLTAQKLIFVNSKSVLVMTGPSSFQLQPKLLWLAVSASNFFIICLRCLKISKFLEKNLDIFVLLFPLEILSYYPIFDISHWLSEDLH